MPDNLHRLTWIAAEASEEARKAAEKWPPMNSAHEAFGVLADEVDEFVLLAVASLWQHVKVNQKRRNLEEMRKEAIQVAAMAIRFVHDICDGGRGRK